jgi:small nuclear ribonucleoprotein (snRNP)-like protein
MKFQVGQVVEIKLKDGRKVKGEIGGMDQGGMTIWNAEVVNPDETVSVARIIAVAFQDIVEEAEEAPTQAPPSIEVQAPIEKVTKDEKPRRRKKPARK